MPIDDKFYTEFEKKFRGTEEDIKNRLKFYIPLLKVYAEAYPSSKPVALDIGCGRGEMLSIYTDLGFEAFGIDINKVVLEETRSKGFNVAYADALDFLKSQKQDTYDVISLIHVLEHLPFEYAFELHKEVLRVLKPGGAYILEFPFAESISIGTIDFWLDPTHLKPIHPDMVEFVLKYIGFEKVDYFGLNAVYKPLNEMNLEDIRSWYVAPNVSIIGLKNTQNAFFMEKASESIDYLNKNSSHRIGDVLKAVDKNINERFYRKINEVMEIVNTHHNWLHSNDNRFKNLEDAYMDMQQKIMDVENQLQALNILQAQMQVIEILKGQINMITSSKPWKFYSFIGKLKKKLLGKEGNQFFFRKILVSIINIIYSNPRLKSFAKKILKKYPNLENGLKKVYTSNYKSEVVYSYENDIQEFLDSIDNVSNNLKVIKNSYEELI